jgi:hypothetical protein
VYSYGGKYVDLIDLVTDFMDMCRDHCVITGPVQKVEINPLHFFLEAMMEAAF